MKIIGITGGTGAGKTTFLDALRERGAFVFDCDAVYHDLIESSDDMNCELAKEFPEAYKTGKMDRKALGSIVFSDEEKLKVLNSITWRYVLNAVDEGLKREEAGGREICAIDAIELFSSGLNERCRATVFIKAPEEMRIKRIMERDNISAEYAKLRIDSQKNDAYFEALCSHVIVNDCRNAEEFMKKSGEFISKLTAADENAAERTYKMDKEKLLYKQKNAYDVMDDAELALSDKYCEAYKDYLQTAKTEREAVIEAVKQAEAAGFKKLVRGEKLKAGDKVYEDVKGKALMLAVIGKQTPAHGANIAAAHIDSPRLDLKQIPLYEDSELAMFKTHYYGGIRKYQWVTIPLELHGTVCLADGSVINVVIGRDKDDPQLIISDLLPHLAKGQRSKPLEEAFTGENLNILVGGIPVKGEESERTKLTVLQILNEKYGMIEEDFLSAEFEAVPALDVRDIGLDRSFIGGYGHDDRVCAYAELKAIYETENPEKTAVCILTDKEEIGSEGISGMKSQAFEYFMDGICGAFGEKTGDCFANSFCISADVCAAFDPNYPEAFEKHNAAKLNYGIGMAKFTGSGGKSGSNDASAEVVGKVRQMFAEKKVVWQLAELGKVDQGGGGTVAKFMADRNIETIDAGVPVLSMHAPYEVVAKTDCYMTYKGMKALYDLK